MQTLRSLESKTQALLQNFLAYNNDGTLRSNKRVMLTFVLNALVLINSITCLFFLALDVRELAAFNLLSAGLYIALISAKNSERLPHDAAVFIVAIELCLHAILNSYFVGSQMGFSLYQTVGVALLAIYSGRSIIIPIVTSGLMLVAIVGNDIGLYNHTPIHIIDAQIVDLTRRANHIFALATLAFSAIYFNQLLGSTDSQMRRIANEDQLTGLFNRRAIENQAQTTIANCQMIRAPICVVIGDVDYFKAINDKHGHAAGDLLLQDIATALKSQRRKGDILARWGGEEFAWILPNTTMMDAYQAMDRIRQTVEKSQSMFMGESLSATMTFGVTEVMPTEIFSSAIARADNALYAGKRQGRNQVNTSLARKMPSAGDL